MQKNFGRAVWADDRIRHLEAPWRKVHYDFQMDRAHGAVGVGFDADQFVQTLKNANVNAVTVFAKNTYGWCHFPSATGPVLPQMERPEMLREQVDACREAGIEVYVYIAVAWDEWLAEQRPDLLVRKRDRSTLETPIGEQPMWTALCLSHPELLDRAVQHVSEVLDFCRPDGIWFDMVYPAFGECYCNRCLAEISAAGGDPLDRTEQRRHKNELHTRALERLSGHVKERDPDLQVDFNTQATLGLGDRVQYLDNLDIEALPTGGWGYWYFPLHARYARNFGIPVYGMSARFHTAWGDYGGLKHPTQLRSEIAGILAQGVRCNIGDQAVPSGVPDEATFATIGQAYADVAALEDHLVGAAPVAEAALLVDGPALSHLLALSDGEGVFPSAHSSAIAGSARLLTEHRIQYDVLDANGPWERYQLVVLPDSLPVDDDLAARLEAHRANGRAVIAAHTAALRQRDDAGERLLWARELAGVAVQESPFQPAFTRLETAMLAGLERYAGYDFALYGPTDRWQMGDLDGDLEGVQVLGRLTEAGFQRWQPGWQSAPPQSRTDAATMVLAAGLALASFPIGTAYQEHGYWIYRELFGRLLDHVLPRRLVRVDAPAATEATLTHQAVGAERPARWLVHVVNYSPGRRPHGPGGSSTVVEFVEDPIPLRDVRIEVDVPGPIARAYEARTGVELALSRGKLGWTVVVPAVEIAAVVVFEEDTA